MTRLVGIAVLHMLHQCGYNYLFVATAWLYVISHHFDPEGCCDQSCDHHQQLRAREDVPGQNPRWGGGGEERRGPLVDKIPTGQSTSFGPP